MKVDSSLFPLHIIRLAAFTVLMATCLRAQEIPPASDGSPSGVPLEKVLHRFHGGQDGAIPWDAGLVFDNTGNLYGTTSNGGNGSCPRGRGTVFRLRPNHAVSGGLWIETVLYNFKGGADGAFPGSALVLDGTGNLYGTTESGGDSTNCSGGCGTVFKLTPSPQGWTETILYRFRGGVDGEEMAGSD